MPAERLFTFFTTWRTAFSTWSAAFSHPALWRSSMESATMAARGLITPFPVYLGAEPPMGSYMLTPSGLMLAPAAMPMPPCMIAPRSVMMSPNMLGVTITS